VTLKSKSIQIISLYHITIININNYLRINCFNRAKRDYASITNGEDIPLFIPKAIPSHFNSNPHKESDPHFFGNGRTIMNIYDMRKSTP
jgi:hypothetical protein